MPSSSPTSPRRRVLLVLLGCLAVGGTVVAAEPQPGPPTPATDDGACPRSGAETTGVALGDLREAFLCLVNERRAKTGAHAVAASAQLQRAAEGHSRDMVARRYFQHDSPDGGTMSSRIKKTGYTTKARKFNLGETLAFGSGAVTSQGLFAALMASSAHAAIIRDDTFREVGVGLERGAPKGSRGKGLTVTLDFGARK